MLIFFSSNSSDFWFLSSIYDAILRTQSSNLYIKSVKIIDTTRNVQLNLNHKKLRVVSKILMHKKKFYAFASSLVSSDLIIVNNLSNIFLWPPSVEQFDMKFEFWYPFKSARYSTHHVINIHVGSFQDYSRVFVHLPVFYTVNNVLYNAKLWLHSFDIT